MKRYHKKNYWTGSNVLQYQRSEKILSGQTMKKDLVAAGMGNQGCVRDVFIVRSCHRG